jgi:D-alanyl-D-alanine dipeptidase
MPRLPGALLALLVATHALACGDEGSDDGEMDESAAAVAATGTVENAAARSCSTSAVRGLAEQLVAEMACIKPKAVVPLEFPSNVTLAPEVFGYLQAPAAEALKAAASAYAKPMTINSALRTLPQQYLLHRWDLSNRCGIRVAAGVGRSNHESGLAVDVSLAGTATNNAIRAAFTNAGFTWLGAGDPVHYDFKGNHLDIHGTSVLAFKRLWNRNNPSAKLTLDETYDNKTEAKLKFAPANGFAKGPRCDDP